MPVPGDLLLWNARLLDGLGGPPREGVAIQIRGGLIDGVTDVDASTDPPEGAVGLGGRTVMPGLIDAHNHVMSDLDRSPGFGPPRRSTARSRARPSSAGSCSRRRPARSFAPC